MPTYLEWNAALIEHATHGAPVGSTVYLEVSDETLNRIGVQWWGAPAGQTLWRGDFLAAVQERCVAQERVSFEWMLSPERQKEPLGVAFLGAMVLAASKMAMDEAGQVHERNYFKRLSDVLGMPLGSQGRPPGLPTGAEELLWAEWVHYLRGRGLGSSARGGEGSHRFIAYPISQCLIPEGQKQRLRRFFAERGYPAGWDGETVAAHLRAEGGLPKKLTELLTRTGAAAEDVYSALQEVLQDFHASGSQAALPESMVSAGTRQLVCGVYREEHWRTGEALYRLFPRHPRGVRPAEMAVQFPWGPEALSVERPGYYRPVGEVQPGDLSNGLRFNVTGSLFVDALVLPAREYWLLRRDPDAEGMFASLSTPGVGEHLLLLVHDRLLPDIQRFKDQELLAWRDTPAVLGGGWLEFHDLMVIGNHWTDVPAGKAQALHEALRPPGNLSIHLEGGARAQRAGAYLAGAAPTVRVMAFSVDAHLTVSCDDEPIFSSSVIPGEAVAVTLKQPGAYELIAHSRGQQAVRSLTVVAWEDLRATDLTLQQEGGVELNGHRIWGAQVQAL